MPTLQEAISSSVAQDQNPSTKATLTIEELTGKAGKTPRSVVLTGGGLPFAGASWESELAMKTTWYPGNAAEATQQVLGPMDMPSQWEGVWRRTQLGATPAIYVDDTGESSPIVDPHILREVIEDIHRLGAKLRVTFTVAGTMIAGDPSKGLQRAVNVRIVRVGRIKQFGTPIDKHTDIHWKATFEWSGRGAEQSRVANVDGNADAAAAANAIDSALQGAIDEAYNNVWQNKNANVRSSATTLTLGQLESIANAPRAIVESFARQLTVAANDFRRVADLGSKIVSTPADIANIAVDFARNTLYIVNGFTAQSGRMGMEQMSSKQNVADQLRAWNYAQRMSDVALIQAGAAIDLVNSVKKTRFASSLAGSLSPRESSNTAPKDIIAVHVCHVGDTPQSLSSRYYGNPDRGVAILRANRLPWHLVAFDPGRPIIIPVLGSAA